MFRCQTLQQLLEENDVQKFTDCHVAEVVLSYVAWRYLLTGCLRVCTDWQQ